MDPALAPRLVAEVLDRVGDVDVVAGDAGPLEAPVEHRAGGADERVALDVLAVAGLLADEHQRARARAPSPITACVAPSHRSQARHSCGRVAQVRRRRAGRDRRGRMIARRAASDLSALPRR